MVALIFCSVVVVLVSSVVGLALRGRSSWLASTWMLAIGLASGHGAWLVANEYAVAGSEAGWISVLSAAFRVLRAPQEAAHWLAPILLGAAAVCTIARGGGAIQPDGGSDAVGRKRILGMVWALLFGLILLRLLWGSVYLTRRWSLLVAAGMVGSHAIPWAVFVAWARRPATTRVRGMEWFGATSVMMAASAVIGMSGSAVYAQLAALAGLGFVIAGLFLGLPNGRTSVDRFPMEMVSVVMASHLWLAHFFAELRLVDGLLLWCALGAVGWYGQAAERHPKRAWLSIMAGLMLALVAVGHAAWTLRQSLANSGGY